VLGSGASNSWANEEGPHLTAKQTLSNSLQRYDLGVYTLVVFGLLFFILSRTAWPQIIKGLDQREKNILQTFQDAEKAKVEAQQLRDQLQAELGKANDQIRQMLDEARRDADVVQAKARADGQADAQAEREKAKAEIGRARDQAMQDLFTQAVQLATLISSKAISRGLSPDDHQRMLDEALGELNQATMNRA